MHFHAHSWIPMDFHEFQRKSVDSHGFRGNPRIPMDSCAFQRKSVDSQIACPWIYVCFHGFLFTCVATLRLSMWQRGVNVCPSLSARGTRPTIRSYGISGHTTYDKGPATLARRLLLVQNYIRFMYQVVAVNATNRERP